MPVIALQARDGRRLPLDVARWHAPADEVDADVLARAAAPVLDIGCGPGRHVLALLRAGVPALGVDITWSAVWTAHARGAVVLQRSVFDRLPGTGRWGTALLLDGNVGIGGNPPALLRRVRTLLRPRGCALVEVGPPGSPTAVLDVRVAAGDAAGPWFPWAVVGRDDVAPLAVAVGFRVIDDWTSGDRWFVALERA